MPPRQRALTIVLRFPAPRTNRSCAATHGLASGPSARRSVLEHPLRSGPFEARRTVCLLWRFPPMA